MYSIRWGLRGELIQCSPYSLGPHILVRKIDVQRQADSTTWCELDKMCPGAMETSSRANRLLGTGWRWGLNWVSRHGFKWREWLGLEWVGIPGSRGKEWAARVSLWRRNNFTWKGTIWDQIQVSFQVWDCPWVMPNETEGELSLACTSCHL